MDHDDRGEIFSLLILEEMNVQMLFFNMMYMIVVSTAAERHYHKHVLKDRTFVRSRAFSLRGKSFPQYDRMATVFGKDRAKRNLSEDPSEAHAAVDHEECENHDDEAINGTSSNLPPLSSSQTENNSDHSRRKRLKASDKWAAGLIEIAGTFGSFLEKANDRMEMIASHIGHAKDLDNDKRKINEELLQMSLSTMVRIKVCRKIVKDPENIHLFLGFQGEDRKIFVEMLLKEMIDKNG